MMSQDRPDDSGYMADGKFVHCMAGTKPRCYADHESDGYHRQGWSLFVTLDSSSVDETLSIRYGPVD